MRWEKTQSWEAILRETSYLTIHGESVYRLIKTIRAIPCHVPPTGQSLCGITLKAFQRLKALEIKEKENLELLHLTTSIMTIQGVLAAGKHKLGKAQIDQLLYYYWNWQRTFNPAAVRPQTKAADELVEQFEKMRGMFEKLQGVRVKLSG